MIQNVNQLRIQCDARHWRPGLGDKHSTVWKGFRVLRQKKVSRVFIAQEFPSITPASPFDYFLTNTLALNIDHLFSSFSTVVDTIPEEFQQ